MHEAKLAEERKMEIERDGTLTISDEDFDTLRELFHFFDKDGSGFIEQHEVYIVYINIECILIYSVY